MATHFTLELMSGAPPHPHTSSQSGQFDYPVRTVGAEDFKPRQQPQQRGGGGGGGWEVQIKTKPFGQTEMKIENEDGGGGDGEINRQNGHGRCAAISSG
ncbi:hypothetical protein TYRP_007074 [Tyrophagus putrescentiae]|nr:hypothetical protein TYRP_007074 [Tyrophagus putrescentiae]